MDIKFKNVALLVQSIDFNSGELVLSSEDREIPIVLDPKASASLFQLLSGSFNVLTETHTNGLSKKELQSQRMSQYWAKRKEAKLCIWCDSSPLRNSPFCKKHQRKGKFVPSH